MKRAITLVALLLASPVLAQPIPPEMLTGVHQSCMVGNPDNRTQRTYCDCTVKLIAERLTIPALKVEEDAMIARTRQGITVTAAMRERPVFRAITDECWARAGVVVPR